MDWSSGQLLESRTVWGPEARGSARPLASVAYVGSPIGGSGLPGGAETGGFFVAVYLPPFGSSEHPVVRLDFLEGHGQTRRTKRSISEGLAILREMQEQSAAKDQEKLERDWLAKHRREYAGQWIALLGDRLISHSMNASDVFSAARAAGVKALVLRVEDSELRFAGW